MSSEKRADFLDQLYLRACEEAPLWELPLVSTNHFGGATVEHGPWSPADCAEVLVRWFSRGPVGVFQVSPGDEPRDLSSVEVARVLGDPTEWRERRDLFVHVTSRGSRSAISAWT